MKAALRQRPEYILVGEIRGKEAYVLFQAMATGHATYSTVHADSAKALIHRLEGKPIEIPRIMLQALDVVSIQITTRVKGKRVRRCKQIIEIIDIDSVTKEILTNEVFRWDPVEDKHIYTGKSYILEGIRARWDMTKQEITNEIRNRAEVLDWMRDNDVRTFKEVAKAISRYTENPVEFMTKIREKPKIEKKKLKNKKTREEEKPEEILEIKTLDNKEEEIEKLETEKDDTTSNNIKENFKEIESISDEISGLLYANGFKSVNDLKNINVKELTSIKGITKKEAKKIIKEVEERFGE